MNQRHYRLIGLQSVNGLTATFTLAMWRNEPMYGRATAPNDEVEEKGGIIPMCPIMVGMPGSILGRRLKGKGR